jgi:branched-chain amino acid aminotransferase
VGYLWFNGKVVVEDEALLALERGYLYGDGLFETLRVYGGRPFLFEEHVARLTAGAEVLGLPGIPAPAQLRKAAEETIAANDLREGSLRLTVVRGRGSGLCPVDSGPPVVLVTVRPGKPYPEELYTRGFRAVLVSFPRNERSPVVYLKSLNFLENILGRKEAVAKGADEGLFVNTSGRLCEGTVSNLFLVTGETIVTPDVASGLLPGITRNLVLRSARNAGFAVAERPVEPAELFAAGEAFLTNSLLEVMPLVAVDGRPVGNGRPGYVTQTLRELYRKAVAESLAVHI